MSCTAATSADTGAARCPTTTSIERGNLAHMNHKSIRTPHPDTRRRLAGGELIGSHEADGTHAWRGIRYAQARYRVYADSKPNDPLYAQQ